MAPSYRRFFWIRNVLICISYVYHIATKEIHKESIHPPAFPMPRSHRFGPVRYFQVNRQPPESGWFPWGRQRYKRLRFDVIKDVNTMVLMLCICFAHFGWEKLIGTLVDLKEMLWCPLWEKSHLGGNLEHVWLILCNHKRHGIIHFQILLAGWIFHVSPMWTRFSHPLRFKTHTTTFMQRLYGFMENRSPEVLPAEHAVWMPSDVPSKGGDKIYTSLSFLGEIQVCKWIPANRLIWFAVVIGFQTYISTESGCFPSTINGWMWPNHYIVPIWWYYRLCTGIDVAQCNWGCWLFGSLIMFIHHLLLPSWPKGLQRKTKQITPNLKSS